MMAGIVHRREVQHAVIRKSDAIVQRDLIVILMVVPTAFILSGGSELSSTGLSQQKRLEAWQSP